MSAFVSLEVILFGLVIGSFLNVVIARLPQEKSLVKPGSQCPKCHKAIRWYQNIPLISFLILRGKCARCKAKISFRYPLVELLTAILFWVSFRDAGLDPHSIIAQLRLWLFIAISICVVFIDLDHRIIPDELSLGGWVLGALTAYWDFRSGMGPLLIASVVGFGFFFGFALLYEKITGRVGLGGGDIKFMGTIGVFLGLGGIWSSLLVSSILGSLVGIVMAILKKQKSPKNKDSMLRMALPYGPFLVAGALIELFFEVSQWIGL